MKLLVAALVLALAPTAHADCAIQKWLGTPSGTTIPATGSLYVYDQGYGYNPYTEGVVFSDGVPHRWEKWRISDDVVRIDYAAGLATSVTAGIRWEQMTYAIDPQWKAPKAAPRAIHYWHHKSEWTCSETDSWMIQVDQPTAAFRVMFTPNTLGAKPIEYIEPAKTGDDGRSVLEIGKHDCIATPTVAPAMLAAGGMLVLYAIRFDGSEVRVRGLPPLLSTSDMRTSDRGIQEAIGYTQLLPTPAPNGAVTNAKSGHVFLLIAGAAVGLLFFGMLLAGRKRAPMPVQM
jgi:hypothetical protein